MTDILFLALVNSITFKISYDSRLPKATISTVLGVLVSKTNPKAFAPCNKALSSEIKKREHSNNRFRFATIFYFTFIRCPLGDVLLQ